MCRKDLKGCGAIFLEARTGLFNFPIIFRCTIRCIAHFLLHPLHPQSGMDECRRGTLSAEWGSARILRGGTTLLTITTESGKCREIPWKFLLPVVLRETEKERTDCCCEQLEWYFSLPYRWIIKTAAVQVAFVLE